MEQSESLYGLLQNVMDSFYAIQVEATLVVGLILLLIIDLIRNRKHAQLLGYFTMAIALVAVYFLFQQWNSSPEGVTLIMNDFMLIDTLSLAFKALVLIGLIGTLLLTVNGPSDFQSGVKSLEYHVLLVGACIGACVLAATSNLLMIYLALEMVSLCSYALANFNFDKKSAESSFKYMLFGAVASGVMLYGMSWIYGFTGSLSLTSPDFMMGLLSMESLPLLLGSFLVLVGFLFKLGLAPFHVWLPDIYQGSPIPVVSFFNFVPKVAALVLFIRFLAAFQEVSLVFVDVDFDWQLLLTVFAILSMFIGNLGALRQTNLKRLMAYSSIAQAGFMMVGVLAFSRFGIHAALFYLATYLPATLGIFALLYDFEKHQNLTTVNDLKGLAKRIPYTGSLLVLLFISLAGLPPTAGFMGKLFIFNAIWETYQSSGNQSLLLLFVIGLFNVVISLFYYLKIPYFMFFSDQESKNITVRNSRYLGTLSSIFVLLILLYFFKADWLMNQINSVNFAF
jgi:NADH-quinone oxidoreductase subunit N